MIIVEINVPSVDGTYEFKLNEDTSVTMIIDEICSVICEKEQCTVPKNVESMMLFDVDNGVLLSKELTLYENNIINGKKLMLI